MSGQELGGAFQPEGESSLLTRPPTEWFDRGAAWLADRCSPILVKECRQALKSRQFLWTFMLLLTCVVGWSFWGLSLTFGQPSEESGPPMLAGYLLILAVPLFLVVPFVTFRSLVSELESETMPLLTITTMTPYRIVAGKLVGSLLQLSLYLSAIVPCIAFTYLLRGIDLAEVGLLVGFQVAASVALSGVALLAAALTRAAAARWIIAFALFFVLLLAFGTWLSFQTQAVNYNLLSSEEGAGSILLMVLLAVASTGWLGFHAAAALVSFPASDRSSRLRLAMLLQHGILLGCFAMLGAYENVNWIAMASIFSASYWLLMGSLASAENPGISERVRRELPRSVLGQSLFGLLMPGPGRGYLFAITQILAWQLVLCGLWFYRLDTTSPNGWQQNFGSVVAMFFFGNAGHALFYLSLNWLLLSAIRGKKKMTPVAGLVSLLLCIALINVTTLSLHGFVRGSSVNPAIYNEYSVYLTGNWASWLAAVGDFNRVLNAGAVETSAILVTLASLVLGGICLLRAARELAAPPGIIPQRVLAELAVDREVRAPRGESISEILAARKQEGAHNQQPTTNN